MVREVAHQAAPAFCSGLCTLGEGGNEGGYLRTADTDHRNAVHLGSAKNAADITWLPAVFEVLN